MLVSKLHLLRYPAVIASLLAIAACTKHEEPAAQPKRISSTRLELPDTAVGGVEIKPVEKKPFPLTLSLPGRVTIPEKDYFVLTARAQGRVDSLPINVGDRVHVGTTLAVLWSADLATATDELLMAQKQGNTELVALSETKLRSLGVSPKDATPNRSSFPLRSIMEGVVLDRKINAGTGVNVGDQIMTIGKSNSFQFQADIPPSDAQQVKVGMKVAFDEAPELAATIESISSIADQATRLVRVRAKFESSTATSLAQETFMKAKVVLRERESLVTSARALIVDENGEYILVRNPSNHQWFDKVQIKSLSSARGEMAFEPVDAKLDLSKADVVTEGALLLDGVLEGED